MENTEFTPESLMANLVKRYEHLNDNNVRAQEVYDLITTRQSKING